MRFPSLSERHLQVIMLEGGGHPVDLALRQVTARSLVATCRDGLADLLRNGARLGSVEVEISGIVHCQLEGSAIVLFADRRAEDARLDLDRHGVERWEEHTCELQ